DSAGMHKPSVHVLGVYRLEVTEERFREQLGFFAPKVVAQQRRRFASSSNRWCLSKHSCSAVTSDSIFPISARRERTFRVRTGRFHGKRSTCRSTAGP